MSLFRAARHVALGADTSNRTGAVWLVADFAHLTVSIQSSTASASRYTLVGSNDDGFGAALGNPSPTIPQNGWSHITAITSQGIYGFDVTGFRWVNAYRDSISVSAASNVSISFAART